MQLASTVVTNVFVYKYDKVISFDSMHHELL